MTTTKGTGTITAKEAARQVLARAGKPLTVKEICDRVLAKPNLALAGKTPRGTIAKVLLVAANRGELFRKVGRATFELIPPAETAKPAAKKPAAKATVAKKATTKSTTAKATKSTVPVATSTNRKKKEAVSA